MNSNVGNWSQKKKKTMYFFTVQLELVVCLGVNRTYPYHGQESVQQVHSQDKGLCAITKEAGQAPQVLHFGISALG